MPIHHRKLLPEQDSDQITNASDCGPTSPYNCDYASFYWPPDPPPLPPPPTTDSAAAHISPYLIVIVALIATAILFISYYFITIRYCARFRQPSTTQVNGESRNFMDEDHQPEVDHPIWYIATIGLQPSVINSITVIKFKKGDGLTEVKDCSVCLSEFEDDESLRLLPRCNHAFHISCIDTWLRSHTNCPLCRAVVVADNSNSISQLNDQNGNHGLGLNRNTQMETQENDVGLSSNQDSKREIETMITLRRSFSMDSSTEVVVRDSNSHNSVTQLRSLNHIRDSRTRRMMMMVRSFSYGGS